MSASDVRAVLWDFGGVILSSPFEAFNRYEEDRGLPRDFIRTLNATNPDSNAIIKYVDPGVTTPAQAAAVPQTILQATTPGSNRVYRGIAMSPR